MERIEIIKELASYAHPSWYHKILSWQTSELKILLDWYKSDDECFKIKQGDGFFEITLDFKKKLESFIN